MKKLLALATLCLFFASCKKEKTKTSESNTPNYSYVTTAGSYWVYDRYQVDSLGNEWLQPGKDTITLVGDTIIGGHVYHKYTGTNWLSSGNILRYERDSLGFIVEDNGRILFSFNNVDMLVHSYEEDVYKFETKIGTDETISTAFGQKTACINYLEVSRTDGVPINQCGDVSTKFYNYYVSGIGIVQTELEYFDLMIGDCSKKRSKLSYYYIAP